MGSTLEWIKQAAKWRSESADRLRKEIDKVRGAASAGEISPDEAGVRIRELSAMVSDRHKEADNLMEFLRRYNEEGTANQRQIGRNGSRKRAKSRPCFSFGPFVPAGAVSREGNTHRR